MMLGGKCKHCGYDAHPSALEFHHKDQSEKLYEVSRVLRNVSDLNFENFVIPEVRSKCELLCCNCHAIEHRGSAGWPEEMSEVN